MSLIGHYIHKINRYVSYWPLHSGDQQICFWLAIAFMRSTDMSLIGHCIHEINRYVSDWPLHSWDQQICLWLAIAFRRSTDMFLIGHCIQEINRHVSDWICSTRQNNVVNRNLWRSAQTQIHTWSVAKCALPICYRLHFISTFQKIFFLFIFFF